MCCSDGFNWNSHSFDIALAILGRQWVAEKLMDLVLCWYAYTCSGVAILELGTMLAGIGVFGTLVMCILNFFSSFLIYESCSNYSLRFGRSRITRMPRKCSSSPSLRILYLAIKFRSNSLAWL